MSVGAVTPIKGFDFLIRSLALIPQPKRPPLLIIGNSVNRSESEYLKYLARQNDVNMKVQSLVCDSELVELYNRARATLYAPILEPFGFVPLESMACGTPVVGVAEGGVRETIRHGETGLLLDRDPRQFADAVVQMLTDRAMAEALGRRGPEYVRQHWSWDRSVVACRSISRKLRGAGQ